MRLIIVLTFIAVFFNASGQSTQMPPRLIQHTQLPFNLEGYTVNVRSNGEMALYDTYSRDNAINVYNQGGIRIEIAPLERISDFNSARSANLRESADLLRTRSALLSKGSIYKMHVKLGLGDTFDDRRRTPKSIQGPTSQVVIHLPSSVEIVGKPIIQIDGITQSEQMVHNLLNIGSVALSFMPGATPLVHGLTDMIGKALDKLAGDFLVQSAYNKYRPSEIIEVNERINFGNSNNFQQITWVLGGHRKRDISSAKTAELTFYLKFLEEGTCDLSLFFNIWGTHSYTPRSPVTMHLNNIVLFSFRQHVVLNANVGSTN